MQKNICKLFFLVFCFVVLFSCATKQNEPIAKKLPLGTLNYKVFINGAVAGKCVVSSKKDGNIFVTETRNKISLSGIQMDIIEITKELENFDPIETSFTSILKKGSLKSKTSISAKCNGGIIYINTDGVIEKYTPNEKFYFSTSVITQSLISNKFKKSSSAKAKIYSPYLNPKKLINVKTEIVDEKTKKIDGKKVHLFETLMTIDGSAKETIFIDLNAIPNIIEMSIMNLKMEMVLQK